MYNIVAEPETCVVTSKKWGTRMDVSSNKNLKKKKIQNK
jgi:hypothetical protein